MDLYNLDPTIPEGTLHEVTPASPPNQPPARKRNLTDAQRKEICLEKQRNPKITQTQLALWAQHTFNLPTAPTQATISNVLAKKARYLESEPSEFNLRRKPRRPRVNPIIEQQIVEWINERTERRGHRFPSTKRIKAKAKRIAKKSELEGTPKFTRTWVASFLKRKGFAKKESKRDKRHRKHARSSPDEDDDGDEDDEEEQQHHHHQHHHRHQVSSPKRQRKQHSHHHHHHHHHPSHAIAAPPPPPPPSHHQQQASSATISLPPGSEQQGMALLEPFGIYFGAPNTVSFQ